MLVWCKYIWQWQPCWCDSQENTSEATQLSGDQRYFWTLNSPLHLVESHVWNYALPNHLSDFYNLDWMLSKSRAAKSMCVCVRVLSHSLSCFRLWAYTTTELFLKLLKILCLYYSLIKSWFRIFKLQIVTGRITCTSNRYGFDYTLNSTTNIKYLYGNWQLSCNPAHCAVTHFLICCVALNVHCCTAKDLVSQAAFRPMW